MRFRYWVSNLHTDEGQYAANGEELDRLIQHLLITGLTTDFIGVVLEEIQ